MKEITLPLSAGSSEDLSKSPHVLSQFAELFIGERQLSSVQQEQRWRHIAQCIHCQTFLGILLYRIVIDDRAHGNTEGPAQELLTRLISFMHDTLKADIAAYAEIVEALGEEEANSRFPLLNEHIYVCQDCQAAVQDVRLWLRQSGESVVL